MEQSVPNSHEKSPARVFALMILTNVLINLDHGILPACTTKMQETYDMNEFQLGVLGSIVYLGISLMGMFAGRLYQHFHSKMLTVCALVMLEVSLLLFVLSRQKVTAYLSRFATGACQVFLLVYYPIWIDKFGGVNKTMWLTLLQICVPVGIFIGYGMTAVIISSGNQYFISFYIQIGLVAGFILAFVLLSNKKLDSRRRISEDFTEVLIQGPTTMLSNGSSSPQQEQQEHKDKYKILFMLRKLGRSKMYLVGTFTMAVILYVSTGIQFWLTKYYVDVLHFEEAKVFIAYAIVSVTGPTSGAGFGGIVINRIGGYEHPHTVFYVFIFSVIGIGSAVVIPFVQNFYVLCTLLWLVLFFGGAMMPGLTGLMMCSVSPYLRAFGNSTGEIIKNLFGYLPSPFIYGLFNTLINERAGIKFLMFWGVWAPILLGFGSWHKYHQLKRQRQTRRLQSHQQVATDVAVYSDVDQEEEQAKIEPIKHQEKAPMFVSSETEPTLEKDIVVSHPVS